MNGLHLTADLYACGCDASLMLDTDAIASLCREQVLATGLTLVDERWVKFPDWDGGPGGVTGTVLLAESHLAIHTWPETGNVTLDVYVCNFSSDNSAKAMRLMEEMVSTYKPERRVMNHLVRGDIDAGGTFEKTPQPQEPGWAVEHLTRDAAFAYRAKVVHQQATRHQSLELLETESFGRVLRLDGRFMTSVGEEFFYHEALVQPAAIAHPQPRHCLIIGGGDGGAAEELLKHPSVEQVVIADLDADVIDVSRRELADIHRGAFDDPRLQVEVTDGFAYLDQRRGSFDLILMDLTDPDTPARELYTAAALQRAKQGLAPGGALVLHLGSPVFHPEQVREMLQMLAAVFSAVSPFGLYIPLYGSYWGLAVVSDSLRPAALSTAEVVKRLESRGVNHLQYYNAQTHHAMFALPNYYRALLPGGHPAQ